MARVMSEAGVGRVTSCLPFPLTATIHSASMGLMELNKRQSGGELLYFVRFLYTRK